MVDVCSGCKVIVGIGVIGSKSLKLWSRARDFLHVMHAVRGLVSVRNSIIKDTLDWEKVHGIETFYHTIDCSTTSYNVVLEVCSSPISPKVCEGCRVAMGSIELHNCR